MDPRLPRVSALADRRRDRSPAEWTCARATPTPSATSASTSRAAASCPGSPTRMCTSWSGRSRARSSTCAGAGPRPRRCGGWPTQRGEGWLRGRGWEPPRWPDGPPDRRRPRCRHRRAARGAVVAGRPHAVAELRRPGDRPAAERNAASCASSTRSRFPLPDPEPLERSRAVRAGMAAANARGVVAVHDFQRAGGRGLWQRLDADRRLHLRVHMAVPVERLGAAAALELRAGFGSELAPRRAGQGVHGRRAGLADGMDAGRLRRRAGERRRARGDRPRGGRERPHGRGARDRRRRRAGGPRRPRGRAGRMGAGARRTADRARAVRRRRRPRPASPSSA